MQTGDIIKERTIVLMYNHIFRTNIKRDVQQSVERVFVSGSRTMQSKKCF